MDINKIHLWAKWFRPMNASDQLLRAQLGQTFFGSQEKLGVSWWLLVRVSDRRGCGSPCSFHPIEEVTGRDSPFPDVKQSLRPLGPHFVPKLFRYCPNPYAMCYFLHCLNSSFLLPPYTHTRFPSVCATIYNTLYIKQQSC